MILIKTIPLLPASRNERDRMHWAARRRERDDWIMMLPQASASDRQRESDPMRRVEVVFRKRRGVVSDIDNQYGRCKVILDALVRRGWLHDDRPRYCWLIVREETGCESTATHIAITDAAKAEAA